MPDWSESPLSEHDADADPLAQFGAWFDDAGAAGNEMPEAAAVATASAEGAPSVRMVLIKQFDERGFVFFTNYESRKALELEANPRAAVLFYWPSLGRQVRIEGPAQRTGPDESLAYSRSRPRGSQLSALASPQSRVVASRETLEQRVAELAAQFGDAELPEHEQWGGFRVWPESYEFWQQRADRLHDRLSYTRGADGRWQRARLAP